MHCKLRLAVALVACVSVCVHPAAASAPVAGVPPLDFSALLADRPGAVAGSCEPDRTQASGAIYRICMPDEGLWNGDLFVYAHGYVPVTQPIAIPEDQMSAGGVSITATVTSLGYAFAATSYSVNGLAVREGMRDVLDLVELFQAQYGRPYRVIIVGVSEGALVTTLLVEERPDVFAGGLAACGPIGDFDAQLQHFADTRVLFDYFFPNAIPGPATDVPPYMVDNAVWSSWIVQTITPRLAANPLGTFNLLNTAKLPIDIANPISSTGESIIGVLSYDVLGANDARAKLGGQPFGNVGRVYTGTTFPYNDTALNAGVQRYAADVTATLAIEAQYQTSGRLQRPLVTLHTLGDPIVPVWHDGQYQQKVAAQGRAPLQTSILVNRYGHCSFTALEVQTAFNQLALRISYPAMRFVHLPMVMR